MGFLTDEEKRKVEEERRKVEEERRKVDDDRLRVLTIDPQGNEYALHLKRWHAVDMIVLYHEWRKFVGANRLQKGDSVQAWGYRRQGEFRLALSVIRKAQQNLASDFDGGSSSNVES